MKTFTKTTISQFTNIIDIGDCARIGLRTDQSKPNWYLIAVDKNVVRRSLGTTEVQEAKRIALDFYQLYLKRGLATAKAAYFARGKRLGTGTSFKAVSANWVAQETKGVAYKKDVLRKFLLPFFAELHQVADIADIDDALIRDYKHWRRGFWENAHTTGQGISGKLAPRQKASYGTPTASTINRELPVLRQILRFACERGFVDPAKLPKVPAEPTRPKRRPAFREDHFAEFLQVIEDRIATATTENARWRHALLRDWSLFARLTGLRVPHEADKLCWHHIDFDAQQMTVPEDTKTGSRCVPLSEPACAVLRRLRDQRLRHLGLTKTVDLQEEVFVLPDGRRYASLPQLFQKVSAQCSYAASGVRYTPYSLRHAFATQHVTDGAPLTVLSKAMGTQTRMLEQHYVHVGGLDLRPFLKKCLPYDTMCDKSITLSTRCR